MHRLSESLSCAAVCTAAAILISCGGGTNQNAVPASSGAAAPAATPIDSATTGDVSGKVTFEGTAPAPQPIKLSSDPY